MQFFELCFVSLNHAHITYLRRHALVLPYSLSTENNTVYVIPRYYFQQDSTLPSFPHTLAPITIYQESDMYICYLYLGKVVNQ
jgi:hypothetical protein